MPDRPIVGQLPRSTRYPNEPHDTDSSKAASAVSRSTALNVGSLLARDQPYSAFKNSQSPLHMRVCASL